MKETGQSASHHNQRSEACFGCKSLPERKRKKKLRTDGLPFRDELAPVLAPLVARFHPDVRVRFYSPEVIVFALLAAVNSRDNTLCRRRSISVAFRRMVSERGVHNAVFRRVSGAVGAAFGLSTALRYPLRLDFRVASRSSRRILAV